MRTETRTSEIFMRLGSCLIRQLPRTPMKSLTEVHKEKRMKRSWVVSTLNVICVVGLLSAPLFAQETTGGVQGTIKDPTDAVIPDATIEVSGPSLIGKKVAMSDA